MITGGNANETANAGFFYLNTNNDATNANQNIGTHLMFCKNNDVIRPHLLVKHMIAVKVLVGKPKVLA